MMYEINNIAVLYGGNSSEREISLESGHGVHKSILELGYKSTLIDFKDIQNLEELKKYDLSLIHI